MGHMATMCEWVTVNHFGVSENKDGMRPLRRRNYHLISSVPILYKDKTDSTVGIVVAGKWLAVGVIVLQTFD